MYLSSNHSRDVRKGKGNLGRRGGRTKTAAIRRKTSIPHDVFLETILPMMPQPAFEKRILKAVKTRNLRDLYGLVGRTATTVPSYLTCNANYTKVAGFSIMLPVLQKLGFQLGPNIFAAAAKKGDIHLLNWLKRHNCPWDDMTFYYAVQNGNLSNLKWLKDNNCPWSEGTFIIAATKGDIDILKWLKENGCPWDKRTFLNAAEHGNLSNMKWLKDNGCPWCGLTFIAAVEHGDICNMKWLKENGCPWRYERAFATAAKQCNINVFKWLKEISCPWDEKTFTNAKIRGNLEIMAWLRMNLI